MAWVSVAAAGASLIGGIMNSQAASDAANQAYAGQMAGLNLTQDMWNQIRQSSQPFIQAGQGAAQQLSNLTQPGGYLTQQFTANDLNRQLAPNYQWQLQTGLDTLKNQANAQGGLGPNEMVALNNYAQNYAGDAYQNAFSNFQTQQNNIFNRLNSIAGMGVNANTAQSSSGTNLGGMGANLLSGAGQAQAAGTIGSTAALTNGLNSAALWGTLGNQMNNNLATDTSGGGMMNNTSFYNPNSSGAMYYQIPSNLSLTQQAINSGLRS